MVTIYCSRSLLLLCPGTESFKTTRSRCLSEKPLRSDFSMLRNVSTFSTLWCFFCSILRFWASSLNWLNLFLIIPSKWLTSVMPMFSFWNFFGQFHPIRSFHLFCYATFYKIIDNFGIVFPTEKKTLFFFGLIENVLERFRAQTSCRKIQLMYFFCRLWRHYKNVVGCVFLLTWCEWIRFQNSWCDVSH